MANRIRHFRETRGLSCQQLAAIVDPPTSGTTIHRLEHGYQTLSDDWMRRLSAALDVHPADLMPETDLLSEESKAIARIAERLGEDDRRMLLHMAERLVANAWREDDPA